MGLPRIDLVKQSPQTIIRRIRISTSGGEDLHGAEMFNYLGESCPYCSRPLLIDGEHVYCIAASCGYKFNLLESEPLSSEEDDHESDESDLLQR